MAHFAITTVDHNFTRATHRHCKAAPHFHPLEGLWQVYYTCQSGPWQTGRRVLKSLDWGEPHLKTARTVRGADWNMVFCEERALAATVPRSPSLSYSAFTFCMDLPVAWASACKRGGLLVALQLAELRLGSMGDSGCGRAT